ncbi:unnamed protein product, partial [Urochloa humidicola]
HAPFSNSNPLLSPEQASTMPELLRPGTGPAPLVLGGATGSARARAPGGRSRAKEREAWAATVEVRKDAGKPAQR